MPNTFLLDRDDRSFARIEAKHKMVWSNEETEHEHCRHLLNVESRRSVVYESRHDIDSPDATQKDMITPRIPIFALTRLVT
jgi:hypothetical protein